MKPLTKIILSITIVALSMFCVALFVMSKNSIVLVVYNPITNSTTQTKVETGKDLKKYVSVPDIQGYTFVNYYSSTDFDKQVDTTKEITNNSTIVLGYCKNITNVNDAPNNVVGIKYTGTLSTQALNTLLLKEYKYLDLQDAIYSGDFLENNTSLTTLFLPQGDISKINNYSKLERVYAQSTTILTNSFNNCLELKNVELAGVEQLTNCFNNCPKLKELSLPQSLVKLENCFVNTQVDQINNSSNNFLYQNGILYCVTNDELVVKKACTFVEEVYLNPNTTKIDKYAFYKHPNIKTLTLNSKVSEIDDFSFSESTLTSVSILQNNVLTMGKNVFSDCVNLANVNFGKGINSIGDFCFYNTALTDISFENSVISNIGNYAFSKCKNLKTVRFIDGQITLGKGLFSYCQNLTTIANLNTLTLPERSFENCNKLINLINFSGVENVGNYAFVNCKALVNITELATIKSAGTGAFYGCESLVLAKFLNLENVAEKLFYNCSNLQEFASAQSITSFNANAFDNCVALQNMSIISTKYVYTNGVVYNQDQTQILYYMQNKKDETFTIPSTVKSVSTKYVSSNNFLKNIASESTAFYCQDGILYTADKQTLLVYPSGKSDKEYTVLNTVKSIARYAFTSCPNLTRLTINDNVEHLECGFLWQNLNLATLNISFIGESINNKTSGFLGYFFGANSFEQNGDVVPESLKEISVTTQETFADYCFYDCANIFLVSLHNASVVTNNMFYNCYNLGTITIGKPLQEVKGYAFFNCRNLVYINFVYNVELTSKDVQLSALTNTPNKVIVTVFNASKPDEIDKFSLCFKNKECDWIWKLPTK